MRKFYATILFALMAMTSFAQEKNDTTYVMLDFTQNPWGYPVREVTSGWAPDYKDWTTPGVLLKNTDFSWPLKGWPNSSSNELIKVTLYVTEDLEEAEKLPVYAQCDLNDAETASLGIAAGMTKMLYTVPGTTMRFEAPTGYKFGKMVFYNFRTANFMVGDDYDEEHVYTYNNTEFKHKLKFWTPKSPKSNQYGTQIWEGDETNVLFNTPSFSAVFVKVDIRLVPNGSAGISEIGSEGQKCDKATSLDGRPVSKSNLRKGIYIVDGKKYVVK